MSIFLFLFSLVAYADTSDALLSAYQREYAFLVAQKSALQRQQTQMEARAKKNEKDLERSIRSLESDLVKTQSANERSIELVQQLEKRKREEQGRATVLSSLWKRAYRNNKEVEHSLALSSEKLEIDAAPPEDVSLKDIALLGGKAMNLLSRSNDVEEVQGTYLNEKKKLVESKILRVGRVAAFAFNDQKVSLLGPDGAGHLQEMENDSSGRVKKFLQQEEVSIVPLFLFQSLQEKATLKKPAGFWDGFADLLPALFLGMLFLMVGWLFFQLSRV